MPRPEPERDQWGRYRLADPDTGRVRSYQRTTTLTKMLGDTTALDRWRRRMTAVGFTRRPDLLDVIAQAPDDRDTVDAMAEAAFEASGGGDGAKLGTELHQLTEDIDTGELRLADVPERFAADVRAYVFTLADAGVEILPDQVERIVVNPDADVAGTIDRIVRLPDDRLVIADLKTAKDLAYSWPEIAMQLATYANGAGLWDWTREVWTPMPDGLDLTTGLVMHLPVGKGVCTLYEVDLTAGWEGVHLATQVRAWRGRRRLGTPVDLDAYRLHQRIRTASSVAELHTLYADSLGFGPQWTDAHTQAAKARKETLVSFDQAA